MVKTLLTITGAMALVGLVTMPAEARAGTDRIERHVVLEREATSLIDRTEEVAREIAYHVERLTRLSGHPDISPWSHYQHLERIKALVNGDLRPTLTRLTEIEGNLPEWKQANIGRMVAAAQQLSTDATSAYFRKSESWRIPATMNEAYRQFVAEMAAHAAELVSTADFAHKYASLRLKAADAGLPLTN